MPCPTCGAAAKPAQKFCAECGGRLQAACPACGAAYEGSPKFCAECGNGLGAAGPSDVRRTVAGPDRARDTQAGGSPPVPLAERRLVSVLFADLVGFTGLSEERDAEAVRELLSRYFEVARELIDRYGGTVEKFIGDAVMAVWGTPVAHEDDAERATRAGLELVEAVTRLGTPERPLQLRAAILTGEAAVTLGAVGQGMVAGDLVNTASRLQSVAQPGTVLVGEETYRSAAGAIAFEPVGEPELKGKSTPVPAYRAVRVVARVGGVGRAEQLEAPFLGRENEFRLIKDLFHATAAERRPRLVSIIGQAGIGKSRMVWELLKYADGITDNVMWHQGRSPAYGEGISFWAVGEMVRSRVGLLETDPDVTSRQKVAEALERFVPDEAERRWIEPKLLQLLSLSDGDATEREELFAAWRTFFERVTGDATGLLVFEDLHWADGGVLDFIEHLLEWTRTKGIFVVTVARPELAERHPDWGAGQRNFTSLGLEPLPDTVIREILDNLVPGLPAEAAGQIVARAQGVPLYAVETVRMLLQDGRIEMVDGRYRPVGDLSEMAVPPTLHALIAARLDALDATDRAILQEASTLGQTFTVEALTSIGGRRPDYDERLRGLVRRELLTLDADPRSPERGQYGFVQALVRDVAYGTLSKRGRKEFHLAAAEYFESSGDDDIVDAVAAHYLDAYRSAPDDPDAEEIRSRATEKLRQAAERAMNLGSPDQALRLLELALEATTNPGERSEALVGASAAATAAGRHDTAAKLGRDAADLSRQERRPGTELQALIRLAEALSSGGRPRAAIAELGPRVDQLGDVDDEPSLVRAWGALARAHMLNSDGGQAISWAERALPIAERHDMVADVANLLVTRGTALPIVGRLREGIAVLRGAIELAAPYGLTYVEVRARINVTGLLTFEDPVGAFQTALVGLELARRLGRLDLLVTMMGNLASAALPLGRWDEAAALADELDAMDLEGPGRVQADEAVANIRLMRGARVQDRLDRIVAYAADSKESRDLMTRDWLRGQVAMVDGRFDEAMQYFLAVVDHRSDAVEEAALAARCALWLSDADAAAKHVERVRAIGIHGRVIDVRLAAVDAGIAALRGRIAEATVGFVEAIRIWRELKADFELARCELDFAHLVGTESPDVKDAAAEARAIFQRLGARPYIERLDEVTSPRQVGAR